MCQCKNIIFEKYDFLIKNTPLKYINFSPCISSSLYKIHFYILSPLIEHTFSTALFPYYWRIFFSVQLGDITVHPLKFKQIQTHSLFLSKTKTCKNINTQERAQSQVVTRQMEPQQQMVTKTKEV